MTYQTKYGEMLCHSNCLVYTLTAKDLSLSQAQEILDCAYNHFGKRKFVFISYRNFASNVDPEAYKIVDSNLIAGIAIVSQQDEVREQAMLEQELYDGAFSYFSTVEQAIDWANTVVKNT